MIVLDTHIWLWWINEDNKKLDLTRKTQIERSDSVAVSAISCLEVAWLERHGRIELPLSRADWFERALAGSDIILIPITPQIAGTAVDLPEHHRDPQDRLIIATAIAHDAFLMSSDGKFPDYEELKGKLL
ncbi:type II toxin-antitoxin system VapC family toxin [cf. Phormidesmis sp. LEGE 11477]|uniref:type II toxin-antitoxin system VapC family toxin n=1 Tax=cf. Phormidesmis sp. LEGE 11477 TaxID=1828680 RepID=UPI00187E78E0|nr:type II toxin-antitoxin system VapC family toxin [cf. Phormidesmis sp. LEGE 11477]MBE9064025.1 type II toxin-antitoxin system VapC family toxin [cf. Phormidesmis sp. LEGE 11477]